jgi:predicted aspartyl protease
MLLADGSAVSLEVYEAVVHWDGLVLQIPVHAAEGDALVGMGLLEGCQVTLQVIDGWQVRIERL